jgi:predicted DNA-binding ribbon-helix-helix protein
MMRLQSPDIRNVRVGGRRTSISVEPDIWDHLRVIAAKNGLSISRIMAEINRSYRLLPPQYGRWRVRSLSSAVRIFVFEQMEAATRDDVIERALAIAANTQIGDLRADEVIE